MSRKNISRSNLFLIELIIVIVFFIFSTSIILRVFAKANELSINTNALNGAIITTQSNAEKYKSISFNNLSTDTQTFYYDKDWNLATKENSFYFITLNTTLQNSEQKYFSK